MATHSQVRRYLAFWFQLGKPVVLHNGRIKVLPAPVIRNGAYSEEFEACWNEITASDAGDCYLEGTDITINTLLTPSWEIYPCARCEMPIPMVSQGLPCMSCPCNDLNNWPNTEMPQPRSPVSNTDQLTKIHDRLMDSTLRSSNESARSQVH